MYNPFKPLEMIKAEVFMSMPAKFRKKSRTAWSDPNRQGAEVDSEDPRHRHLANIAFGGPDRRTLYITESLSGDILMAKLPVAGKLIYGLS